MPSTCTQSRTAIESLFDPVDAPNNASFTLTSSFGCSVP
jgi:hypothetical protein